MPLTSFLLPSLLFAERKGMSFVVIHVYNVMLLDSARGWRLVFNPYISELFWHRFQL